MLCRLTILDILTPSAGFAAYLVKVGPVVTSSTFTFTLKLARVLSIVRTFAFMSSPFFEAFFSSERIDALGFTYGLYSFSSCSSSSSSSYSSSSSSGSSSSSSYSSSSSSSSSSYSSSSSGSSSSSYSSSSASPSSTVYSGSSSYSLSSSSSSFSLTSIQSTSFFMENISASIRLNMKSAKRITIEKKLEKSVSEIFAIWVPNHPPASGFMLEKKPIVVMKEITTAMYIFIFDLCSMCLNLLYMYIASATIKNMYPALPITCSSREYIVSPTIPDSPIGADNRKRRMNIEIQAFTISNLSISTSPHFSWK